jgi:pyruvate-ferredoxin/flavodoxin oxidoreductase
LGSCRTGIALQAFVSEATQELISDWLAHREDSAGTQQRAAKLTAALTADSDKHPAIANVLANNDLFVKPSQWMIGGDGWAYDIGFGGIDHVLASGADVNILVLDNEVYSNTGGQVSKATPASAIAKFAANGKYAAKKDLGMMAMTYGHVYVAQIASGANQMQTIKAFEEAERFPGPSLIITYTPCITHGLAGGMRQSLKEAKEAVASGYWSLYRYNPLLSEAGKTPMTLDFKKPDFNLMPAFMDTQIRFASLKNANATASEGLFAKTVNDARTRFYRYARIAGLEEKIRAKLEPANLEASIHKSELESTASARTVEAKKERKARTLTPEEAAAKEARRAARAARRKQP